MDSLIPQTDWSMIYDLSRDADERARAMDQLVRRYWPAIYAYIRRTGRDVHEASDLTQGFITTVILQRELASKADERRGRFRSLLLTALRNYLRERHRSDRRRSARVDGKAQPTITGYDIEAAEGSKYASPEEAFSYHWSAALVRSVLERTRAECVCDDLDLHWAVFEARVARPLLFGETPTPMPDLVERLDLQSSAAASNMVVTVKRRFARILREEVGNTVMTQDDIEDELRQLMRDLNRA